MGVSLFSFQLPVGKLVLMVLVRCLSDPTSAGVAVGWTMDHGRGAIGGRLVDHS